MPAARPTRFCSATPSMKKRSGYAALKSAIAPAPRSEPMNTTRSSSAANSVIVLRHRSRISRPPDGRQKRLDLGVGHLVLVVPLHVVLGERGALPLDGVRDHRRRLLGAERKGGEELSQLADVVAVDLADGESERPPLVREGLKILHLARATVGLV